MCYRRRYSNNFCFNCFNTQYYNRNVVNRSNYGYTAEGTTNKKLTPLTPNAPTQQKDILVSNRTNPSVEIKAVSTSETSNNKQNSLTVELPVFSNTNKNTTIFQQTKQLGKTKTLQKHDDQEETSMISTPSFDITTTNEDQSIKKEDVVKHIHKPEPLVAFQEETSMSSLPTLNQQTTKNENLPIFQETNSLDKVEPIRITEVPYVPQDKSSLKIPLLLDVTTVKKEMAVINKANTLDEPSVYQPSNQSVVYQDQTSLRIPLLIDVTAIGNNISIANVTNPPKKFETIEMSKQTDFYQEESQDNKPLALDLTPSREYESNDKKSKPHSNMEEIHSSKHSNVYQEDTLNQMSNASDIKIQKREQKKNLKRDSKEKKQSDDGLHGRGLLNYKKWWFLNEVDVNVNGDLIAGIPIFLEQNTLRVVNDKYSYFIPIEKIDYIRTSDGLNQ